MRRFFPLPPWSPIERSALPGEVWAAIAVTFLAVPQGMAYATIAELPPAMGLYAATIPAIVGSLMRSSRHVVSGPTNALSLLVGAALLVPHAPDPAVAAVTLALMVGVIQVSAGVLRLGAIVDFVSTSVVTGYITGAGVLIGLGQLYNITRTEGPRGQAFTTASGWVATLSDTHSLSVAFALGTVALLIVLRKLKSRLPGAVVVLSAAIVVNIVFSLEENGLKVVRDLASVPSGLPPLTLPDLSLVRELLSVAVACSLLSLIESNAVARAIAARTGQRLDASTEFTGQGLANLAASFFGGYPVSGSLSRSVLNESAGASTRLAGVLAGLMMLGVLLVAGPLLDHTPVAALAGLLVVVAWDLVDRGRIQALWGAGAGDRAAFVVTMIGTWVLPLDVAILVGVGLSMVLYLRRARLLNVRELFFAEDDGEILEGPVGSPPAGAKTCQRVRIVQISGALFFGAASELDTALRRLIGTPDMDTLVVRLRRASDLDATASAVLAQNAVRMKAHNQRLVLVDLSEEAIEVLRGTGTLAVVGEDAVHPAHDRWLTGLSIAVDDAVCAMEEDCSRCPLRGLAANAERSRALS